MNDEFWILILLGFSIPLILFLVIRMYVTDPMLACKKHKKDGCYKVNTSLCKYPNCETLKKFVDI
jgi:hypothetical protein